MKSPRIRPTDHALLKLQALKDHGVELDWNTIEDTIRNPSKVSPGYQGRLVAQKALDDRRVLRVIYEETQDEIVVVTLYPGRRSRYE